MMKTALFIWVCITGISLSAQTSSKNNEMKLDVDYYLMLKEFDKALDLCLKILKTEPGNADIKHSIGICYLNSESDKAKAIPYLEEAVQKISTDYNPNSLKEENASFESLFTLGSAYRVNNELDKAIDAYNKFKEYLDKNDDYNRQVADQYIRNCNLAREMQAFPVGFNAVNLGDKINDARPNFNAVVSADGKTLAYTSPGRQGYEIWISTQGDSGWTASKNITTVLGTGNYMKTCDLSSDGLTMLLALDDPVNSDIYISRFSKGRWSKVEPLGKTINSKMQETHASFSPDNNTLYFTSNRKGGEGDLDIYKSVMNAKGEWGKPENLGPGVNTPFNEETPFISDDGQVLYFSSEGHEGIGGYDVFRYSLGNVAGGAVNLGYPVNTTDNNLFYFPVGDGTSAYYSFVGSETYGGRDVYAVRWFEEERQGEEEMGRLGEEETAVAAAVEVEKIAEEEAAVAVAVEEEAAAVAAAVAVEEAAAVAVEEIAETIPEPTHALAPATAPATATATAPAAAPAAAYSVQIMALRKPVDLDYFTGLPDLRVVYSSDRWYRYTVGTTTREQEAAMTLENMISKGYHDAFIRNRNPDPRYTIQIFAVPGPVVDLSKFSDIMEITVKKGEDNFCRYTTGEFGSEEEAAGMLESVKKMGYSSAFIRSAANP
ncbi:MAG: PD40 domain-containing protein [Bacteroidales bacterium]|nr:PD40 domain-containing protein [Bacteroidales bacterium]